MTARHRPLSALLLALALSGGTLAHGGGPASAAAGPTDDPARGLRYGGLERGPDDGPCKGSFQIRAAAARGGPARCSHGPDAAPEGVDVRVAREPDSPASTAALAPEALAPAEAPACSGDGTSGARVQLAYANIAGKPDRYAAFADSFQVWAGAMDSVFNASAAETGGGRRIRFVHDGACRPTVSRLTLSTAAAADFDTTVDELFAKGFTRNDRKYLVWVDANVYCGIGEVFNDDRAGQDNYNNVYGLFSRVDNGCWGLYGQSVEAHELMHNLGGVQASAPHATAYNHCTDDRDRMCYADGSGATLTQVCPSSHENRFDCNHDDYFHTAPAAGSYLASHWNVANSAWLVSVPQAAVPSAPSGVTAVPGEGTATVSWTAPGADGGAAVTGYVITPREGTTAGPPSTFQSTATTQTVTGLINGTSYTFTVAATNALGTGPQSLGSAPVVPEVGSRYNPLPPARLLDTRSGNGAPAAKVAAGGTIEVQVTGRRGVPATGVAAVVLNVTVTDPAGGGFLTAWPSGDPRPLASNVNFNTGQTVPNLVVVKVGADGRVTFYNGGGATHLVADVSGWYGASAAVPGSRYHPLAPARLLDSRTGNGSPAGKLVSSASLDLQVTGRGGVPASGVSAVVLNVTVTEPVSDGYLTAWPTGEPLPLASNLNFVAGQTVPNLVVVKVGVDGKVGLYNGGGAAHLVADVAGWFGPDGEASGSRYHPVLPARVLDSRAGNGSPVGKLVSAASMDLQVTGRGGLPATGVGAVVLNVTVTDPVAGGYLTVWPTGDPFPLASNLNFVAGQTVPNLVVVKVGTGGKVSLYNGGGSTHVVADVAGWYGAG